MEGKGIFGKVRGKKAIFLTLGLTFIGLTILAYANILLKNAAVSEERVGEIMEFERLHELDVSIGTSLTKFYKGSELSLVNFSLDYGGVEFTTHFFNYSFENFRDVGEYPLIFGKITKHRQNITFSSIAENSKYFIDNDMNNDQGWGKIPVLIYNIENQTAYLETSPYPYNIVFLKGLNDSNTNSIEVNISSHLEAEYPIQEFSPCNSGYVCVQIIINLFGKDGSFMTHTSNFETDSFDGSERFFDVNVSDTSGTIGPIGENYTISINGFVEGEYNGLLIGNPVAADRFKDDYNLGKGSYETINMSISVDLKEELRVSISSKNMQNINLPFVGTKAVNKSIRFYY